MNQPLAYVHPGAKIAKNVVIEPFTTIHNNVIIGDGTWIGSNVTIMEGARIVKGKEKVKKEDIEKSLPFKIKEDTVEGLSESIEKIENILTNTFGLICFCCGPHDSIFYRQAVPGGLSGIYRHLHPVPSGKRPVLRE